MTKETILKHAKVIFIPLYSNPSFESDFSEFMKTHETERVIPTSEKMRYEGMIQNSHHYTTNFHYNVILPKIDKLLGFGYNKDDFNLIENLYEENGRTYDFSYFVPKKKTILKYETLKLTVPTDKDTCYTLYGNYASGTIEYEDIVNCDSVYNGKLVKGGINESIFPTKYHKMFKFVHQPSRITNETAKYDRTLLVCGSSHSALYLPVLTYYFKKIVFLDNRNDIGYKYLWENEDFTDVLFELYPHCSLKQYTENNFM